MSMNVLPAHMSMYHTCAWCLWRSEEGIRFPRTGVTDDQEHHVGTKNPPKSSEEQPVLLTAEHLSDHHFVAFPPFKTVFFQTTTYKCVDVMVKPITFYAKLTNYHVKTRLAVAHLRSQDSRGRSSWIR